MRKIFYLLPLWLTAASMLQAQPWLEPSDYDITKDRLLYTVGYAHLDTEWNWDYPTTINEYILNTMVENLNLFEKYPDYVFNFTGSRRYKMMKEYYPKLFDKVKNYVAQGRWKVSGSSVDEGEVNISSSESLVRQVLYGNNFFRSEFGKESMDYMLPDCFGFSWNLPSILHHCGLIGFSTQKLTWHSAAGVPFNVGIWKGPDGKGVIAALNATSYTSNVENRLDKDSKWISRLNEDKEKTGYAFDYRYYGVGDQGGAPRMNDVRHAVNSLPREDSNFKVLLTSSDQMYKDITPEIKEKLPVYSGDLLLIEHSAGSLTSQAFMKRMNRKNELLASSAEMASVAADWMGGASYPFEKLNHAWDLLLGSQFHDILPGTAIPKAYEYAWNDEFIAANEFAEVLKHGVSTVAAKLNTQTRGRAIVVYNPVAKAREDVVEAELEYAVLPESVGVFDKSGKEVPSQIVEKKGNKLKILFLAEMPSAGLKIYDVRETASSVKSTGLSITNNALENAYYRVKVASNGDIISIFDKKASKELLAKPARLEFLAETPNEWPAWNMDWKDRKKPPIDFMDKDTQLTIVEQGPVRVTLKVQRKGRNSEITQFYSLAAGEAGKRLEVSNKIDWQSRAVSLKASFPLTVSNENATYNLGVGTISRSNNNEKKFEVPSKEWFDLTDKSGKYGVTILEDCKYGSDKPDDNTLRLTLLYTPGIHLPDWQWTMYQSTQDWGIHDVMYAVYGHNGDWRKGESAWQAQFFNQPLLAFESTKHGGEQGGSISMISINRPEAGLMALKKMESGEGYVIRINELTGKNIKNIQVMLPAEIVDAYEINGQEKKIGDVKFTKQGISFDLSPYTIRSFAVKVKGMPNVSIPQQTVEILYNTDVISSDENRED
ncbi:MAG TPA: glycoside hydrolase family 38 C-terminal domain-containing protein, partial [Paludibacteraceae bacterium]|nr:glycoside hydrolase family 38 C-terminal domain-containing protein [Paludibacteraceae bacterium]